jgi:hypothetical protein
MHKLRHTLCVSLVFVLSAMSMRTHAEEPKPEPKASWQQLKPERLVSDGTFIYLATPDFKKARTAFERTAFRALLREEEISIPLLTTYASLRDAYVKGDGTRNESDTRRRGEEVDLLMKLAPLFDGQLALAIDGGADTANMVKGTLPRFVFMASLPSGDEGEKRYREISSIMERHRSSQTTDPRFKDSDERLGNYDVVRIENTELALHESWAFCENLFIYGQGKKIVEDAIDRYLKNSAGTLALHSGYQTAYDQVGRGEGGDALVYVQADMRPLLKQIGESSPIVKLLLDPKPGSLEANRPHFALGMHVSAGDKASIREKIFVRKTKDELPKNTTPCTSVSARFAQSDSLFYKVEQNNLAESYKNYLSYLKMSTAASAGPEGKDPGFDRLKTSLGATTDAELASKLELFKGEMAMLVAFVPQPNLKMDSMLDYLEVFQPVFVAELDSDNAIAEQTAKTLLSTNVSRATGHEYIQTLTANVPMWHQKGAGPREEKAGTLPNGFFANLNTTADAAIAPFFSAYSILTLDVDGGRQRRFLLMSDSLNAIKKAIRQVQPENAKSSLAEDSKLKDVTKGFRESRNSLSYLELKKLVDVYSSELPRLAKTTSISSDLIEQLPSAGVLREHVFPMAWASSVVNDPEGMLIESNSPMGNLPMIGLVGSIAWPAIVAQRQKAISDEVDVKFKKIMVGLHLYAADFDRYPMQLSDVYKYVNKDLALFESPFRRGSVKQIQDIDVPDLTNLVYVPSRSLQDLGDDILVYEKEPTKLLRTRDGIKLFHHIITLDGKKTFVPTTSLERRLSGKAELLTTNIGEGPVAPTGKGSSPRRRK